MTAMLLFTVCISALCALWSPASASYDEGQEEDGTWEEREPAEEDESFPELQSSSNTLRLDGGRHIVWGLLPSYAALPGIALYDNGEKVLDISGTLSGTTAYSVPSGSVHSITMMQNETIVLAAVSV